MDSEAGRRTIIDFFLIAVLSLPEFNHVLEGDTERAVEVHTMTPQGRRALTGRPDYHIGHAYDRELEDRGALATRFTVVEAKMGPLTSSDYRQTFGGCAQVYKERRDSGLPNRRVFGATTNAEDWRFIVIDNDGACYRSAFVHVELDRRTRVSWTDIERVYQALYFMIRAADSISSI
ncbi:hypothetical protein HKX48_005841 [Thoreauomyces humboldtii]|nr:hypothetical protein HKX48_005841 [Thoreauomyces humboldtii]